jgi:hypothetical protein
MSLFVYLGQDFVLLKSWVVAVFDAPCFGWQLFCEQLGGRTLEVTTRCSEWRYGREEKSVLIEERKKIVEYVRERSV